MSDKAQKLGASTSFARAGQARSARRQLIDATLGGGDPTELPLHLLSHNPDNPRENVGDVSGLAASLREVGLVQALTVASVDAYLRSHPGRASDLEPGAEYVVVDGHRRLAGAREAGLDSVRVMVDDTRVSSDEALLEASFVANAQRENLTELEEAQALKSLVDFYGSQHKAAARLGLSQAVISQRLSLLHLTPELQADLQAGRRQVKHVRGLAKLNPEEQKEAADARAQDTKQEAESRRQNGKKPVLQTVPPAGGADSTDRAAESTGTGQDLAADRPRADAGVPRQSSAPHHSSSDAPPAGAEDQAYIDSLELPWDDPMWFDWVLRRRMTPENRTKLAWLLSAEEPSGA